MFPWTWAGRFWGWTWPNLVPRAFVASWTGSIFQQEAEFGCSAGSSLFSHHCELPVFPWRAELKHSGKTSIKLMPSNVLLPVTSIYWAVNEGSHNSLMCPTLMTQYEHSDNQHASVAVPSFLSLHSKLLLLHLYLLFIKFYGLYLLNIVILLLRLLFKQHLLSSSVVFLKVSPFFPVLQYCGGVFLCLKVCICCMLYRLWTLWQPKWINFTWQQ